MSGTVQAAKSQFIRIPNDTGRTQNDFDVAKIAVTTTHGQYKCPANWAGQIVHFFSSASDAVPQVALSKTTNGEVATDAAASNTTAGVVSNKAGMPIPPQSVQPVQLPFWDKNESAYLIHESAINTTLYVWRANGY